MAKYQTSHEQIDQKSQNTNKKQMLRVYVRMARRIHQLRLSTKLKQQANLHHKMTQYGQNTEDELTDIMTAMTNHVSNDGKQTL